MTTEQLKHILGHDSPRSNGGTDIQRHLDALDQVESLKRQVLRLLSQLEVETLNVLRWEEWYATYSGLTQLPPAPKRRTP
jgi:hypothetical protein